MALTKSRIKYLKSLQQKKCRDSEQCYIAEGLKIVNEATQYHSQQVLQIICTNQSVEKVNPLLEDKICITDQETINKISSFKTPQACMALLKMPMANVNSPFKEDTTRLALESVRDPGNLGTIIRLADWFGITQVICSEDCVDCFNPKVIQASMGAILRVNIIYVNLKKYLKEIVSNNIHVYGTTLEGKNLYQTAIKFPAVILMGNESKGISNELKPLMTEELLIPNYSKRLEKTESLNVSSATSIVLSEFMRLKHYSK